MITGDTPAGATMPVNDADTKPGMVSLKVGTSGMRGLRASLYTASARIWPVRTKGSATAGFSNVSET
jgi:hypothetical protein